MGWKRRMHNTSRNHGRNIKITKKVIILLNKWIGSMPRKMFEPENWKWRIKVTYETRGQDIIAFNVYEMLSNQTYEAFNRNHRRNTPKSHGRSSSFGISESGVLQRSLEALELASKKWLYLRQGIENKGNVKEIDQCVSESKKTCSS